VQALLEVSSDPESSELKRKNQSGERCGASREKKKRRKMGASESRFVT